MMNAESPDSMEQGAVGQQDTEPNLSEENLVATLTEQQLNDISEECKRGFEEDLDSREDWEDNIDDWTKLAKQTKEDKSYPWPGASNIKYPLVSTAAMQFAARSYPSLVPSNGKIVNATVIGKDPKGEKLEKADRVSLYMSYQLLNEMSGWEEDMDKMLMMLPIVGTMFKKTWYDKSDDKVKSQLILPKNIVINYWTKCLDEVERVSEIIYMSKRIVKEKQNLKIFADIDLGDPTANPQLVHSDADLNQNSLPYTLVEQHGFLDLDEDGYAEPYIITFELNTGKILRIVRRYLLKDVELQDDGKTIAKIKPIQMFTKFGFIPNPDGSFYDIGFGLLLGPINESVNTLINQLVDSGHIHNMQSGFVGKALRLKMGDQSLRPGEWRPVNATADDLRKQIVPLPTKEPSSVLFQLMGTLITSGKELASVAEIFTGKMPGQNTPATTTMATVEQGMKVFTAVYKRIFRALAEEFKKVFELNGQYLDPNKYIEVLDIQVSPEDFDSKHCDVVPGADPTATTQAEKLQKAQGLLELLQMAGPMLDPIKIISRVLEAQDQPNWEDLFNEQVKQTGQVPPPPPDPKVMALQAKMQADQQTASIRTQAMQQQMELSGRAEEQQMAMKSQQHAQDMSFQEDKHVSLGASALANAQVKIAAAKAHAQQGLQQSAQQHQQKMEQQSSLAKTKLASGAKAK